MNQSPSARALVRKIIVAATLGVAAIATWTVTWSETPRIVAAASSNPNR